MTLLNAPTNFDKTLGELAADVSIRRKAGSESDVIVLFETRFA